MLDRGLRNFFLGGVRYPQAYGVLQGFREATLLPPEVLNGFHAKLLLKFVGDYRVYSSHFSSGMLWICGYITYVDE